jgi:hypothetical protein
MSVDYEAGLVKGGANAVDVSPAGLFLGTPNPLPVGTLLQLRLGETTLRVRVARVVEADAAAERTPGMGVAIVEIDSEGRKALRAQLKGGGGRGLSRRVPVVIDEAWPDPVTSPRAAPASAATKRRGRKKSDEAAAEGPPRRRGRKRRDVAPADPEP